MQQSTTSQSSHAQSPHHSQGWAWRAVVWPALLITCIGAVSILFLICCARVSELELDANRLQRQIDEQIAVRSQLWRTTAGLHDRAELRQFVREQGMILAPAGTDQMDLPPLPPEQWAISPLSPQPRAADYAGGPRPAQRQLAARHPVAAAAF